MDNIVKANEKRVKLLKAIDGWGFYLFILTGIVGCSVIESFTMAYGGLFVIIGIFVDYYVTRIKDNFQKDGGALTRRILSDSDLRGLKKDELEQLRMHIYAKNGYNFNINEGLYILSNIRDRIAAYLDCFGSISSTEIREVSQSIGCSVSELEFVLNCFKELKRQNLESLSEERKDEIREGFESRQGQGYYKIGKYNRDGGYNPESKYFYDFKIYDWYKPTTNNLDEVYSKMSEIEKYNVEFIKAREDDMN